MRQSEKLADKIGAAWCVLMHDAPMWPIHGHYRCRDCGREFPALVEVEEPRAAQVRSAVMTAVRSS